ncbi:HD domain-containing protein [Nesterenkonia halobia]|uniref:HD domain-containing protein n=1 Tax=Nesterenkonia halobia TaxID=37922 RepID=A0ABP6RJ47_9MICC
MSAEHPAAPQIPEPTAVVGPASRLAAEIAAQAHAGQADKAGVDYIQHPARVARRLAAAGEDDAVVAAGWLHDTVEDTGETPASLRAAGVDGRTAAIVERLTRGDADGYEDYLRRAAADAGALAVKRADLADNADPERLAALDPELAARLREKYRRAAEVLDEVARDG